MVKQAFHTWWKALCTVAPSLAIPVFASKQTMKEGSCKIVKEQVQRKRGALGLSTTLADSVPHAHETNGAAERAIQTVRRLANTFLDTVRSKAKIDIPHSHPLVSWALKHSSWILNRFHKHSATQRTAFEIMTGFPYSGKLITFGWLDNQMVFTVFVLSDLWQKSLMQRGSAISALTHGSLSKPF